MLKSRIKDIEKSLEQLVHHGNLDPILVPKEYDHSQNPHYKPLALCKDSRGGYQVWFTPPSTRSTGFVRVVPLENGHFLYTKRERTTVYDSAEKVVGRVRREIYRF